MFARIFSILFAGLFICYSAEGAQPHPPILESLIRESPLSNPTKFAVLRRLIPKGQVPPDDLTIRDVVSKISLWTLNGLKPDSRTELVHFLDQYGLRVEMSAQEIERYKQGELPSPSVGTLGLSRRALRSLYRMGLRTIQDLNQISQDDLQRAAGKATIHEIKLALRKAGIKNLEKVCSDSLSPDNDNSGT